jgi:hypothetical protein
MDLDRKLAQLIEKGEDFLSKGIYSVSSLENLRANMREWESEIREVYKAHPEIEPVKDLLDEGVHEPSTPASDLESYIKAQKAYIEQVLGALQQYTN